MEDWSIALDAKLSLILNIRRKGTEWDIPLRIGAWPVKGDALETLEKSDTYFVHSDICELINHSQQSLPDLPLTRDVLSSFCGCVYFSKSILLNPDSIKDPNLHGTPCLRAFTFDSTKEVNRLLLHYYEDVEGVLFPISFLLWPYGDRWGADWIEKGTRVYADEIEPEVMHQRLLYLRKITFALFSFMKQDMVITELQQPSRSSRRRFEKSHSNQIAPSIKVIALRHKRYGGHKGKPPMVWSCRWMVRGHWRNQFYRQTREHKLKWIVAYVKGPKEKPFRMPSTTVFDVKR